MKGSAAIIAAVLFGAALCVAAFLFGGRYEAVSLGDRALILDRFTGEARTCQHLVGCTVADNY